MDQHSERIWQRGNARQIMREARQRFRTESRENLPAAHVAFASVHYSLIKQYVKSFRLLAAWHAWRAAYHVNVASTILQDNPAFFHNDQIDIMSTIWLRVPEWLGGDRASAEKFLKYALGPNNDREMKPHTRAFLNIRQGEILLQRGDVEGAWDYYCEARHLIYQINDEDLPDREQQLVRVLRHVGFFYYDQGSQGTGVDLLKWGKDLAARVAQDQYPEIVAGAEKRGIDLE
jgi:hypothetical protein